jgi:hypothetical protein
MLDYGLAIPYHSCSGQLLAYDREISKREDRK